MRVRSVLDVSRHHNSAPGGVKSQDIGKGVARHRQGTEGRVGLGHPLNGTPIIMLIHGYNIRVIPRRHRRLLRRLTIIPERRDHGTAKPIGGPSRPYGPYGPRKNKKPEPR